MQRTLNTASGNEPRTPLWRTCALIYAGVLFIISTVPVPEEVPGVFGFDELMHFGAYALLGWLVARTFKEAGRHTAIAFAAFVISLSYRGLLEAWQHFLPERTPSIADVVANGAGGLAGGVILKKWF